MGLTVQGRGIEIVTKTPPSHVSSEGGARSMVGRERKETPSDLCFKQGRGIEIVTKTPPSRVSSKGGARGVVSRGREEIPLRLRFQAREGYSCVVSSQIRPIYE